MELWIFLGVLVLVTVIVAIRRSRPFHFATVERGVLYRSGLLEPPVLKRTLARYGIRTVVTLKPDLDPNDPWHELEEQACEEAGARLVDLPLVQEAPPTTAQINEWLDLLREPDNHAILVHCHRGAIRTAMMVAIYEIAIRGRSNEDVLRTIWTCGHRLDKPHRAEVRDFIASFRAPIDDEAQEVT